MRGSRFHFSARNPVTDVGRINCSASSAGLKPGRYQVQCAQSRTSVAVLRALPVQMWLAFGFTARGQDSMGESMGRSVGRYLDLVGMIFGLTL